MRILVYGLQSSGASIITYFLAQKPDTIALLDVFNNEIAPAVKSAKDTDILIKCTINSSIPLKKHLDSFKPDKTILVLRHPYYNYASLKNKQYSGSSFWLDKKFKALEACFNNEKFDLTLHYEDMVFRPSGFLSQLNNAGFDAKKEFFKFNRTREEILRFNKKNTKLIPDSFRYGPGNIHPKRKNVRVLPCLAFRWISKKDMARIKKLCPKLCDHYEKQSEKWKIPKKKISL